MNDSEWIRSERKRLKRVYRQAFERLNEILFQEDPVGINFEDNTDEYEPEVGTILPRLAGCGSAGEVRAVIHEEFVRWFDAPTAGPPDSYTAIAERTWNDVVPIVRGSAGKEQARMVAWGAGRLPWQPEHGVAAAEIFGSFAGHSAAHTEASVQRAPALLRGVRSKVLFPVAPVECASDRRVGSITGHRGVQAWVEVAQHAALEASEGLAWLQHHVIHEALLLMEQGPVRHRERLQIARRLACRKSEGLPGKVRDLDFAVVGKTLSNLDRGVRLHANLEPERLFDLEGKRGRRESEGRDISHGSKVVRVERGRVHRAAADRARAVLVPQGEQGARTPLETEVVVRIGSVEGDRCPGLQERDSGTPIGVDFAPPRLSGASAHPAVGPRNGVGGQSDQWLLVSLPATRRRLDDSVASRC